MKYFLRVIVVLLVATSVIFVFSNNYRKSKIADSIVLTTQKIGEATEKADTRILVAENEESGYKLYKDNGTVILCKDDVEQSFDIWYPSVSSHTPELYYNDFDDDGEKELLIIMISNSISYYSGKTDYFNAAVLVDGVKENDDSSKEFITITAGVDSWKAPFTSAIKCEMNQLISCDKYIQFVMDDVSSELVYDEATGISSNKYVYYARALKNGNGSYAQLERWQKGACKYSVSDDGKIKLDITVLAYYQDIAKPQILGCIDMTMHTVKDKFDIVPKSISFIADDAYFCSDPRVSATEGWTKVIKNSAQPASVQDTDIDWIEAELSLPNGYNQTTVSFAGMTSEIKNVDRIEINEGALTLYAKEGYAFSNRALSSYSVTAKIGPQENYDISYSCKIDSINGENALTVYFDKTYNFEDLKSITVKYGV